MNPCGCVASIVLLVFAVIVFRACTGMDRWRVHVVQEQPAESAPAPSAKVQQLAEAKRWMDNFIAAPEMKSICTGCEMPAADFPLLVLTMTDGYAVMSKAERLVIAERLQQIWLNITKDKMARIRLCAWNQRPLGGVSMMGTVSVED